MMNDTEKTIAELNKVQEKLNKLPKHDFGIYEKKSKKENENEFTGRIIITEHGHIFENVGLTITVMFSEKFAETGQYDINIEKSYYPKERATEIQEKENDLVRLISDIIGLNLARCFYNVILTASNDKKLDISQISKKLS